MLRVGLTGGLGSGKSTVAAYLRELGAEVIEADALGRELMQPDQPVYEAIVGAFGPEVAEMAFRGGRLNELNSLVHPPVIAAQQRWMDQVFARNPAAVAVVESALIFEVERDARARGVEEGILADWRQRIDRIVLVTASDDLKIARFVDRLDPSSGNRAAVEADGRARLAHQIPDAQKVPRADYILDNTGDLAALRTQVGELWLRLKTESNSFR